MYKQIIRPLLFKLQPETVHHLAVKCICTIHKIPFAGSLLRSIFKLEDPRLERTVAGIHFPNPVMLAAGFDKDGSFYNEFASFGFGALELGTVTPKAQPGNPQPRSFRLPKDKALINRMGFNNLGVDALVENLKTRTTTVVVGANIGKNTATSNEDAAADYDICFQKLYASADYFVVNVSCPNVANLGKLQNQDSLTEILLPLVNFRKGQATRKPLFLKVSPDLSEEQLDEMIDLVQALELDALVLANTTTSREGLVTDASRIEEIANGGLSGAPLKDKSTAAIRYVSQKTEGKLPIIGVGGILSAEDALEKFDAGAHLVQIYTGFIYEGPSLIKKINKALLARMK